MSADAWALADPTTCPVCGRDSCEDHLPDPAPAVQQTSRPHLTAVHARDVISAPAPAEVIEGIAWAGCVTVLVAESGAGKTFALLSLAAAVSADLPWHGRHTRHGSVVHVGFEGDAIGLRLRAQRDVQGQRLEHVYVIRASDPLSPRVTRDGEERSLGEAQLTEVLASLATSLATAKLPPIRVVMIDTVRASLSGSEDSSEHVSAYLRAVRRIMTVVPDAAMILSHHAGWQDGDSQRKRERGSSAWRGNCDATLYLEAGDYDDSRGETPLTLRTLKVRDREKPVPLHLVRRRVELGDMDRYGQPVTSCVIEPDRRSREDREAALTATLEAEHRTFDFKTLRTITERPDMATSQDRIRLVLGIRKAIVSDSLSRLVRAGWVVPGSRNQPYQVTPAGVAALEAS